KSAVAAATDGPAGESAQDEPARRIQQSLAASWAPLRGRVAAGSHDTSTPLDELRIESEALAAAWDAAVAAMRTAAQERRGLIDRVAGEHTSLPDMASIAQARSELAGACDAYQGALRRHRLRLEEEQSAAATARASLQELWSALTTNALPEECHPDKLAAAVVRYRNNAGRWLQATVDAVQANGRATITAGRALERGEAAESAETDAAKADQAHREKQTALKTLVDSYGEHFAGIVAELESLEKERATLGAEWNQLDSSQLDQVKKQTTAEQQEKAAVDQRNEAERARSEANNAFLAACRLGVLTAAGLPDSPAGVDSNRAEQVLAMLEQPSAEAASGLGVRAVRDWARSVRDAAGDLRRDVDAVEHTANRVKEIRYNLEPNLAGQVSVRDEQHHGVLVLHATRSLQTLS